MQGGLEGIVLGIQSWWQAMGDAERWLIWMASGLLGLTLWGVVSYLVLHRLAGHRRFQGRWYSRAEYAQLMQVLWEDQQAGSRVMSRAELSALRHYRYGHAVKPILSGKGGGYFDV